MGRVLTWDEAAAERARLAGEGRRVVFTNGVFDLLHRGHVELLAQARTLGDALFLGLNSDASTRRLKGERRPLAPQEDRAVVLAALAAVDAVVIFDEDTPAALIARLRPDVLVKGADYAADEIVGRDLVEAGGGRVVRLPLVEGRSSSAFIEEIVRRYCSGAPGAVAPGHADHSPGFLKLVDEARRSVRECTIDDVLRRQAFGEAFHFVDVREDFEFAADHAEGAVHIGRGILERDVERLIPDKDADIVLYCGGGFRSVLAAESLQKMGYRNVCSMAGGIRAWRTAGYPLETGLAPPPPDAAIA